MTTAWTTEGPERPPRQTHRHTRMDRTHRPRDIHTGQQRRHRGHEKAGSGRDRTLEITRGYTRTKQGHRDDVRGRSQGSMGYSLAPGETTRSRSHGGLGALCGRSRRPLETRAMGPTGPRRRLMGLSAGLSRPCGPEVTLSVRATASRGRERSRLRVQTTRAPCHRRAQRLTPSLETPSNGADMALETSLTALETSPYQFQRMKLASSESHDGGAPGAYASGARRRVHITSLIQGVGLRVGSRPLSRTRGTNPDVVGRSSVPSSGGADTETRNLSAERPGYIPCSVRDHHTKIAGVSGVCSRWTLRRRWSHAA